MKDSAAFSISAFDLHIMKWATVTAIVGASLVETTARSEGLTWRPRPRGYEPLVSSQALQDSITVANLLEHEQALEDFAYATPQRNRLIGSKGVNDSIQYVYDTLKSLGDYYDVQLQPWNAVAQTSGSGVFLVNCIVQNATLMEYSASGNISAPLVPVNNLGCDASDYPASVAGSIALISRGTCPFGQKSSLAGVARAVGAVIYNNIAGPLSGTLGVPPRPEGPYVPTMGVSLEQGTALLGAINNSTNITGTLNILTVIETQYTNNVIATSKCGDQNNTLALGAHIDSVAAGPGINDDGSGTAGILETAIQLSNYTTKNAVRFAWWSGEEEGLLGSTYYVTNLPETEADKIRLYLNFDMIASPNYIYAIYDGDGRAFNLTGPPGSAEAEALFEEFFADKGLPSVPTEFNGRSDYGPFLDAGIPSAGLFTGAEGIKTAEEALLFGGEAGVAYDVNYHRAGDNLTNLALDAFLVNTQAIAAAVAEYATSFDSLPAKNSTMTATAKVRRNMQLNGRKKGRRGVDYVVDHRAKIGCSCGKVTV